MASPTPLSYHMTSDPSTQVAMSLHSYLHGEMVQVL